MAVIKHVTNSQYQQRLYSTDVIIRLHYIAVQHSKTALIPKSNLTQPLHKVWPILPCQYPNQRTNITQKWKCN